ncbi:MAG TPA: phosphatase PAP2 family protein [Methylomirabilota bacterium]|nr:phosphatase PAP2 family protein [Methylomirabilota bacterium]
MSRKSLLTLACLTGAGYLALALIASQAHVYAFEHGTRALVAATRGPFLDRPMQAASVLGDEWGLVPLIAMGTAALWTRHRRWASALPLIMLGTGALQWLAKWSVDRPRPNLLPLGFPSGHVLSAVVLFGLAAYWLCRARSERFARGMGVGAGAGLIGLVASSRLYLEAHWFLDVVGGLLLGVTYLLLLIWVGETVEARARGRRALSS